MAVLQALRSRVPAPGINHNAKHETQTKFDAVVQPDLELLWVGSVGGMEADLVKRAGVPYTEIEAAGVHGVGWRALPGNVLRLARGYLQARAIIRSFRPQALFFTGGYLAAPMALAGRNLPSLLYVPDIEPGLALKSLARLASQIAVSADESRRFFPNKAAITVTGYPVRPDLTQWDRLQAQQMLGLAPELPVLLVFGGSKGARSINRAAAVALPALLPEMQVVHITGKLDWPEVQQSRQTLPERLAAAGGAPEWAGRYHTFPYLHDEMGAAFAAADLAVCRAGASTLGELPAFGLPAILVPYPHAWRYQRVNANYLAERGAALVVEDHQLTEKLSAMVLGLMSDRTRLQTMHQAMRSLARPQAADEIAALLQALAASQTQHRM
jgi:UDP-N-acetylglucosamine--N-acetylmuramyl-(pentapeptide) pyrophosphoryl-undecaprenol N-acetylglucosamine transferase